VIDSLSLTLGIDAGSIKKFDIFRKKRNISDYELCRAAKFDNENGDAALHAAN